VRILLKCYEESNTAAAARAVAGDMGAEGAGINRDKEHAS